MFICPNCWKKAITLYDRIRLTPFNNICCKECNQLISLPLWTLIFLVPIPICTYISKNFIKATILKDFVILAALIISIIMYLVFSPMRIKKVK